MRIKRYWSVVLALSTLVALALPACRESRSPAGREQPALAEDINRFTPVVAALLAPPVPVQGSDGRFYFVYELLLSNANEFDWKLLSIDVLAAEAGEGAAEPEPLYSIRGDVVAEKIQLLNNRAASDTLGAGQSALLFIAFSVDSEADIPHRLIHRLAVTVPGGLPGKISSFLQLPAGQQRLTETVAPVAVKRQAVVDLAAPLRGNGWVAANGCCDSITHTRSALPINGAIHISQRFAIDWLKLNEERRLYSGDPKDLHNWFGYGQPVLAVADGVVATAVDKFYDQVPFELPADTGAITLEEIDGNHVIVALGNGQYAFYAHLQHGSIRVKAGERVRAGQLLGLVGNTGNSGAPHLHFHIMQGGSSLGSNGLPYTFKDFVLLGETTEHAFFDVGLEDNTPFVDEGSGAIEGNPVALQPLPDAGPHRSQLPLNLTVVEFPQRQQ